MEADMYVCTYIEMLHTYIHAYIPIKIKIIYFKVLNL